MGGKEEVKILIFLCTASGVKSTGMSRSVGSSRGAGTRPVQSKVASRPQGGTKTTPGRVTGSSSKGSVGGSGSRGSTATSSSSKAAGKNVAEYEAKIQELEQEVGVVCIHNYIRPKSMLIMIR